MNEKIFNEAMLEATEANRDCSVTMRQKVHMVTSGGKTITFKPKVYFGFNWRIESGTLITNDGLYLVVSDVVAIKWDNK